LPRPLTFDIAQTLEAALKLFWLKGYAATSIQDLVGHLGISRSSLYDTFGDKQQLYQQAIAHYRSKAAALFQKLIDYPGPAQAALQYFLDGVLASLCADPERKGCFMVNFIVELAPTHPEYAELAREHWEMMRDTFRRFLTRGIQRGELRPDANVEALATHYAGVLMGIQVMAKAKAAPLQLRQMADMAVATLPVA